MLADAPEVTMGPPRELPVASLATTPDDTHPRHTPGSRRSALPLYALSLLLLTTAVSGFIWYDLRWAYRDTLAYWDVRMSTSAIERVSFADLWLNERQTDVEGIAGSALAVRLLSVQANGTNLAKTQQEVEQLIERMARINRFLGGAVADTECRIAAQTGLPAEAAAGVRETCNRAQRAGDFQVFVAGVQQGHVWLYLAYPVFAAGETSLQRQVSRHALGAAVMIAEPWERTFPFMSAESEPQASTQTLLVWEDFGKTVIFSPRLGMEGVESVFRRSLSEPTLESRAAHEGNVGFGEYTDHRGVRVFAVARPLGRAQASLVRKVNRDEALSEFHRRVVLEWLAGILSTLLLGSVIVIQERHLTTRELKEKLRQQRALLDLKRHVEVSEERFRELVESVDAIVWEADAATLRPTFVSQGAERILGFSPAQWLQTPDFWADHLHPDDRERGLGLRAGDFGKRQSSLGGIPHGEDGWTVPVVPGFHVSRQGSRGRGQTPARHHGGHDGEQGGRTCLAGQ
jgi:PAS domain-containing protein